MELKKKKKTISTLIPDYNIKFTWLKCNLTLKCFDLVNGKRKQRKLKRKNMLINNQYLISKSQSLFCKYFNIFKRATLKPLFLTHKIIMPESSASDREGKIY